MQSFHVFKLITAFATPLGLGLLLVLLGLLLKRRWIVLVAVCWLWLWSTPWAAVRLAHVLEDRYPLHAAAELPNADVIVLLGGGVYPSHQGWHPEPNLTGSADRLVLAAKLLKLGKAPRILYSGGSYYPGSRGEAVDGAELLRGWGVPAEAIGTEERSRTTRDNADFSLPMLKQMGAHRVLLVTSVWHMRRSMQNFQDSARSAGVEIEFLPAACDPIEISEAPLAAMSILPNTEALNANRALFKELLGLAYAGFGGR